MKITKTRLKQIIKEELAKTLTEAQRKGGIATLEQIKKLDPNFKIVMDIDKAGNIPFLVLDDIGGPGITIHHPFGKFAKPDIRDKSKMIMGLAGESNEPETRRLSVSSYQEAMAKYQKILQKNDLPNYVMSEALK